MADQVGHDELKASILIAYSRIEGVMCWNHPTGVGQLLNADRVVRFGLPGSGDIIGAARGRPLSVEVKTGSGRQATQQKKFQRAWEKAGGAYILARSLKGAVAALNVILHEGDSNAGRLQRSGNLTDARGKNAGVGPRAIPAGEEGRERDLGRGPGRPTWE